MKTILTIFLVTSETKLFYFFLVSVFESLASITNGLPFQFCICVIWQNGKNYSSNDFANGFAILVNLAFERLLLTYLGVGFWIGKRLRPVFLRQFRARPGLFGAVSFVRGSPCAK